MNGIALITTGEAAKFLGVNASRVRQMLLAGDLTGTKIGRDWAIKLADVDRVRVSRKIMESKRHPRRDKRKKRVGWRDRRR